MARAPTLSFPTLLAFTLGPAAIVGAGLWFLGSLVQDCAVEELQRLTAPDRSFDLIVFERNCGATTTSNTQAALIPVGDTLPNDAASFVSVASRLDLAPLWDGEGNIVLTLPADATVYRQDESVAGVSVIYR